jgi:hypothetical protein
VWHLSSPVPPFLILIFIWGIFLLVTRSKPSLLFYLHSFIKHAHTILFSYWLIYLPMYLSSVLLMHYYFLTSWEQVGFEVLTAVVMKSINFWDITPCSPLRVNQCFGGTYRLHLQGPRSNFSKNPESTTLYPRSRYSSSWEQFHFNHLLPLHVLLLSKKHARHMCIIHCIRLVNWPYTIHFYGENG